MGQETFQVRLTESALNDLHEIDDYWIAQREPERGEQYVRDLLNVARQELTSSVRAMSGRLLKASLLPETREILVFKGSYRLVYRVDAAEGLVHVLRFWHSHRDEPEL